MKRIENVLLFLCAIGLWIFEGCCWLLRKCRLLVVILALGMVFSAGCASPFDAPSADEWKAAYEMPAGPARESALADLNARKEAANKANDSAGNTVALISGLGVPIVGLLGLLAKSYFDSKKQSNDNAQKQAELDALWDKHAALQVEHAKLSTAQDSATVAVSTSAPPKDA